MRGWVTQFSADNGDGSLNFLRTMGMGRRIFMQESFQMTDPPRLINYGHSLIAILKTNVYCFLCI